ncbi:hypothetical protein GCM10011515_10630 [Tsuneonella deserti]|uniref:Uncharacterized protein n=1 Tax=Tsuneonella deserti TaxID=2035528 RepID=A0ABQ1S7K2_9SPHN|nr:hypothetical protein [Tsuneonella deserti]GGD92798.1 hypothetical protein GCM10011515_10630 [Tsuneonella deserti]
MKAARSFKWTLGAMAVIAIAFAIRFLLAEGAPTIERDGLTFASPHLATALQRTQPGSGVRIISTFRDGEVPCKAFVGEGASGIACRERGGWHLRVVRSGVSLDDPAGTKALELALRRSAAEMSQ